MGSLNLGTLGIRFVLLETLFLARLSYILVLGYAVYLIVYYNLFSHFPGKDTEALQRLSALPRFILLVSIIAWTRTQIFLTVNPRPLPSLLRCISYLLLCNKLPQNLVV